MAKQFLIVDEILRDRAGHWFEENRPVKNAKVP